MSSNMPWWAKGVLFENCNCELLCRAHLSYSNLCDQERCLFHWAFHINEGAYGDVELSDLNVFIIGDAPQQMISVGWTEALYIDARATAEQRVALIDILTGKGGGPWKVLASFVTKWLEPSFPTIEFIDDDHTKSMRIEGVMETSVERIKAANGSGEVRLTNVHNQIHPPDHTLAMGSTCYSDQGRAMNTDQTHAIYSHFDWRVN